MTRKDEEFPFDRSRKLTRSELANAHAAVERKLGKKIPKRGRPPMAEEDRAKAISIRLHPRVIEWAKKEAKKRGGRVGYQTVINDALIDRAGLKKTSVRRRSEDPLKASGAPARSKSTNAKGKKVASRTKVTARARKKAG